MVARTGQDWGLQSSRRSKTGDRDSLVVDRPPLLADRSCYGAARPACRSDRRRWQLVESAPQAAAMPVNLADFTFVQYPAREQAELRVRIKIPGVWFNGAGLWHALLDGGAGAADPERVPPRARAPDQARAQRGLPGQRNSQDQAAEGRLCGDPPPAVPRGDVLQVGGRAGGLPLTFKTRGAGGETRKKRFRQEKSGEKSQLKRK